MIDEISMGVVSHIIAAKVGALLAGAVSYLVARWHINDAEKRAATWREGHERLLAIDVKETAEIDRLKGELATLRLRTEPVRHACPDAYDWPAVLEEAQKLAAQSVVTWRGRRYKVKRGGAVLKRVR